MITDKFLYELGSTTMDPCSITKDAHRAARETWLCTGCTCIKRGIGAVDVALQQPPKSIPLNFVYGVGIGVIRRDFLQLLGDESIRNDLLLGKVFDANGREVPEYATFRGRTRLMIRGNEQSGYRRCEVCGRHIYSPMGKFYVLSEAPGGRLIYESQIQGLIVGECTAEVVRQKKWKELAVRKLPVLDTPQDGKPIFSFEENMN